MTTDSINAYDLPERVISYDVDMELMHPRRTKMIDIALELLPTGSDSPVKALDLGAGTGYFTYRFLSNYPDAKIIAVDGAKAMVDLAKGRLGDFSGNVSFRVGDFRGLKELIAKNETFDVIYSSYALHHLNYENKLEVIKQALSALCPGGWFLNADLIAAENEKLNRRYQEIRIEGIVKRAQGKDPRFVDNKTTRKFLDKIEDNEGDQPLSLFDDLQILKQAGLKIPALFWAEYREAVIGGIK